MKRLFVAITILFCSLPIMASLSLRHIYYTHNDHLGSASWITRYDGKPTQYMHYLPYGQLLANQMPSSYNERFKFLGKERDLESGYDYLGARYLITPFKHFASVEPLLDKYLYISPYSYAAWNPIRFIDPNGQGVFNNQYDLRRAGETVVNNPQYSRRPDGTTFCNMGAQSINRMSGDVSVKGTANEMGRYLRNPQNATALTQTEALSFAREGAVVFASYISDNGHGHIAIVSPSQDLNYSKQRNENVVSVYNIGNVNGEMTLAQAFGDKDVGLYILNSDIMTLSNAAIDGGILPEIDIVGSFPIQTTQVSLPIEHIQPTTE